MPSLKFPDTGTRYVELVNGRPAANQRGLLYADEALTVVAEAYVDNAGVKGALLPTDEQGRRYVTLDAYGRQVDYWGPESGQDRLWIIINGVRSQVDADYNIRIDGVETRVATLEGVVVDAGDVSAAVAAEAALRVAGDATAVSTAATDAATKASAAQAAAIAASAQRSANLSDLGSAATARTNLGLGNVDNTSDANKPLSTAATTALGGKVGKGDIVINVRDAPYNAVGDCAYVDQRVTGTFGLASAVPTDATTFGKGYTNSTFTTAATDNTAAFQAAWDALMNAGALSLRDRGTYTGYRAQRKELRIPAGAYYIADGAGLFSLLRTSPSGTQSGIRIRGDGRNNTILYVRITVSGSTDWLFYDQNWGNGMALEGLTIICTTGNERIISHTSTGNAKRWKIYDCHFEDYKVWLSIGGTVNADRWVTTACEWTTRIAGATLMTNPANTQAVAMDFHSPAITHLQGGTAFDFGAGGHVRLFGGSTDLFGLNANGAAGRFAYLHGDGSTLGIQLEPSLTVNDHKFELHDDSMLADVNFNTVRFMNCGIPLIGNTRWANGLKHHVVARGRGRIVVEGGMLGDAYLAVSTNTTSDYQYSNKASILVRNAVVENNDLLSTRVGYFTDATDGLTTDFVAQTGTGSGTGIGRIQLEACAVNGAVYSGNPRVHVAVNGSPYAFRSWSARPTAPQRVVHRYGSAQAFGLPDETQSATIRLPIGCQIAKVGIVKLTAQSGIGSNSRTWKVSDGNGTVYATLTTTGTTSNVSALSADLFKVIASTNDATLTLTCDANTTTGTGAEGYFFVDYI